ncbi:MAG: bifunctional DNA primase/polymerase [Chloroflexota bacterium]|nr:bifunctional DNA primase/polymerase [Chloroflexota bacterium]
MTSQITNQIGDIEPSALLDQVIYYAGCKGWHVIPIYGITYGKCLCGKPYCNSQGKHPILSEWQRIATTDETVLREWWKKWPKANIGIVTGRKSDLLVLDIDPRHGGEDSLALLEHKFGRFPKIVEAITGSGGRHLFFAYPKDIDHISNAAPLSGYPGIDVRADGGYIVAPPSLHYCNETYKWKLSSHPDEITLAPVPDWLLRLLIEKSGNDQERKINQEPGWVSKALAGVKKGERDDTCFRLAMHFKNKGIACEVALILLNDWAAKCMPPFSTSEVEKCIRSAYSYNREEQSDPYTSPRGFKLTWISDLIAEPEEITSWIWEKTLPTGGLSLVAAKPKVGKSTWARNLALKVARGERFLGRDTTQGPVIYLALEEKRSEVAGHFLRMSAERENILIHTGGAPEEALIALEDAIRKSRAVLAIVDTLFKIVRVKDGNDYVQVNRALEPLLNLARDTNCHILAVHHMSKGKREGGEAILGSTALFASVDTALFMKERDTGRTIESSQRYGEDIPKTALSFDPGTGIIESTGTLEEIELGRVKAGILQLLSDSRMTEMEIRGVLSGNTGLIGKGLRELIASGEIERDGLGKRGDPFIYEKKLVSCIPLTEKQKKRRIRSHYRQWEAKYRE